MPSFRSQLVYRRTYSRPLEGGRHERFEQTVLRVIRHQRWLWQRAIGRVLNVNEENELATLEQLLLERKVAVSGRTMWLGGTDTAKTREASQFNCSFLKVQTVFDVVDAYWLLLQGCGVGFEPVVGTLNGFTEPLEVEFRRSMRTPGDGHMAVEGNQEFDIMNDHYIVVGDSAEAWAKAIGKLMAYKGRNKLVIDTTQIRAAGQRLGGYGWISQGDAALVTMIEGIVEVMNARAGELLRRVDIVDIMNMLGTSLSSRRAAEIALVPATDAEALDFATMKKNYWEKGKPWRAQSNNSLVFWHKPSRTELHGIFMTMLDAGGSEPGFINAVEAKRRAPWFKGVNPCAEILLGDKSFCNLVEVDWGKFINDPEGLFTAIGYAARANYRQTCVNLRDGVLSSAWHESNEFLRLCGVGATGLAKWLAGFNQEHRDKFAAETMKYAKIVARKCADHMADALGLPRAKAVTTIKPSGTMSKLMDTTEGVHKPLGRYVFNNINFSKHDPLVQKLHVAGYAMFNNPLDPEGVVVTIPVDNGNLGWDKVEGGIEVNLESAVDQLDRYKLVMEHYVDHNCSITVSYDPSEVPEIVDWLDRNWDTYVGVSFILRNDPTKTAKDLGYPYLPQEVVTKKDYDEYVAKLADIDIDADTGDEMIDMEDCEGGVCPIR